jgi:sugar phosphate isomerase/epimerase
MNTEPSPNLLISRRESLLLGVAGLATLWSRDSVHAADADAMTLSIGNYGMKSMPVEKAIALIAEIGYDGVELSTMPEWDSTPSKMNAERRTQVRKQISDAGLVLTSLMENLPPPKDDQQHQQSLARLKGVMELAHDLAGESPRLVQTVLGGGKWEDVKSLFRDRLGDWVKLADETKTMIAIKPHRGGAMSRPSEAIWLIEQLGKPERLRIVYDYSHYAFRDMPVAETVAEALPCTAHVAVKDAVQKDGKIVFDLPGVSGGDDLVQVLKLLYAGGYRGDICCEISAQLFGQPGYDASDAARRSYAAMEAVFQRAGVPRRGRSGA